MEIIKFQEGCIFPSREVKERDYKIEVREMLYNGEETEVFLSDFLNRLELAGVEHYSVFDGKQRYIDYDSDTIKSKYASVLQGVNVVKPISNLFADLLFAEGFRATDNDEQANIWLNGDVDTEGWLDRVYFQQKCHKGQIGASIRGNAVFKIYQDDEGLAQIEVIPAKYWYPVYNEAREKEADALVYKYSLDGEEYKESYQDNIDYNRSIIRVTKYYAGYNVYQAFILSGNKIIKQVQWDENKLGMLPPNTKEDGLDRIEETGYNYSMLQTVTNEDNDNSIFGNTDYTDATVEQIRELCVRATQVGRILDKNSDPGMAGPSQSIGIDAVTGENIVRTQGKYFQVDEGDVIPQYITWNADLQANYQSMQNAMNYIYQETGTNAAALAATTEGIQVISGAALEKVLMRPLSKVKVKKMFWTPVIRKILMLAYQIENGNDTLNPKIKWFDGLPKSRAEELTETQLQNGKLPTISQLKAIMMDNIGMSEEDAEEEYQRLLQEQKDREGMLGVPEQIVFGEE